MKRVRRRLACVLLAVGVLAAVVLAAAGPDGRGPALVAVLLATGSLALRGAWQGAAGTALRPGLVWAWAAWGAALAGQIVALGEPSGTGRPWAGHLSYLASIGALAFAVSILNARRPGAGAWSFLTTLLIAIFLIPWLEGSGLARDPAPLSRLRLDSPWWIFFAVLSGAAVVNHLPTRFWAAAVCMGLSWLVELAGLRGGMPVEDRPALWWMSGGLMGLALVLGAVAEIVPRAPARNDLERLWLWFRDHWGVVWALRVRDRFNQSAEALGWPIRLAWPGVVWAPRREGSPLTVPPEALPMLKGLLHRFASPERLDAEAAGAGSPCDWEEVVRS
jgi:hypothetical protein